MLSGDLMFAAVADGDLTLRLDPEDAAVVQVIDDASGAVLSEELLSNLDGESGFAVRIEGAGYDVDLSVEAQVLQSAEILGAGGVVFDAGTGENTLKGPDASNVWRISGEGSGDLDDGVMRFSGVENLIGGSQADRFVLEQGGLIEGVLDGGLGEDTLTADDGANNWTITGINEGVLDGRAPTGDEIGQAQSGNTIVGGDDPTVDEFGNILPATGSGGQSFAGMENLGGGAGDDSFVFDSGGLISGAIDGGEGDDSLFASGRSNLWEINARNAGRVNAQDFSGVENLGGSSGSDEFLFADGAMVDGVIDGGAGFNTMDFAAYSGAVALRLLSTSDTSATSGVRNVQRIQGGSSTDDRLGGSDENNTWLIEGRDEGSVGGLQFTGFENLEGGDGRDDFVFSAGGALSGTVDGGGGFNKLGYSTFGAAVTLNLETGETTGTGGFQNIQRFIGSAFGDTLIGADSSTLWSVTSDGTGTANGFQFTGVENLRGGSGNDRFLLEGNAAISGTIDGGGGANTLDYSYHEPGVSVDVAAGGATGAAGFSAITDFVGSLGEDTLHGPAADSTWYVSGENSGHVGAFTFAGIENLAGAADNEDTFVLQDGGSLSGVMDGGPRGFDSLVIEGGDFDQVIYQATGPDSGTIDFGAMRVTYAGLEPISDNANVANRVLDYSVVGGDTLVVRNHATAGRIEVLSAASEDIDFANPTGSLKIITGGASDTITLQALDAAFDAAVIIEAGGGVDNIIVQAVTGTGGYTIKGQAGNDNFTLDGIGAKAITVVGGTGDDDYYLKDGWGYASITELAGQGNDHLKFAYYTGTLLTVFASGSVLGSDFSTVSFSNDKVENYDDANLELSTSYIGKLVDGLEKMEDWLRGIAGFGDMATELPFVNKNVGVAVSTALDLAEAISALRLKLDNASHTAIDTVNELEAVLTSFSKSLAHLGPSVVSDVFNPSLAAGTYSFGIKVDGGGQFTLTATNPTNVQNLRDQLLASLSSVAPDNATDLVIDVTTDGQLYFQPSPLVDEKIEVKGVSSLAQGLGFASAFQEALTDALKELNNLLVNIGSAASSLKIGAAGFPELRFDLDYNASRTTGFNIDLGPDAAERGLIFDQSATLSLQSHMDFDFALGLRLDGGVPDFFLDVGALRAYAKLNAALADYEAQVGFLGVKIDGSASIDAGIVVEFDNPGDAMGLSISDLNSSLGDLGSLIDLDLTNSTFGAATSPTMALSLTVDVDAGLGFNPASVSVGLVGSNPFAGHDVSLTFSTNFADLANFNSLSDKSALGILQQLGDWLDDLRNTEIFSLINIPFVGEAVDNVLDLADVLTDALLFDDGDDGVDGVDNENAVNNDVDKLFEFDTDVGGLVPSFSTAQELATRLASLGLLDGLAEYVDTDADTNPDTLRYDINISHELLGFEVPLDFKLDLSPLLDLTSDTRIVLDGAAGLNMTLGFDIGASAAGGLTGATTLASLGVQTQDKPSATGTSDVRMLVGQLTGDATFHVSVNGGATEADVEVEVGDTDTNETIAHLVADVNAAIAGTALNGKVTAEVDPGGANKFQLRGIGGTTSISVTTSSADPAARELGLATSASASSGDLVVKANKDARTIVGRLTPLSDATFSITIDGSTTAVTVNADYDDAHSHDTAGNTNILDLVSDMNAALTDAGLDSKLEAAYQGNKLVLQRNDGGSGSFSISGAGASELGFSSSQSSNTDDFIIVDSAGTPHDIDLSSAVDIDAVMLAISTQSGGAITAAINPDNPDTPIADGATGLVLTDTNGVGGTEFQVKQTNASRTAQDLGIQLRDRTSSSDTEDAEINGGSIVGSGLADRFFISTDSQVSATLRAIPGRLIEDLKVVSSHVLTSEDFTFKAEHDGLKIEIKDVEGFNDGTYEVTSVDTSLNRITLNGGTVGTSNAVSGVGILLDPIDIRAKFGFVEVSLTEDDGSPYSSIQATASLGFDPAYGPAADGKITLNELIDGLDELGSMITGPTLSGSGALDLELDVTPAIAILAGGPWDIDVTVADLGSPYIETSFSGTDFTFVDATHFKLSGDQTGSIKLGAEVVVDPGTGPLTFQVLSISFDSDDNETTIEVTSDTEDVLTAAMTAATIDTPTAPSISLPDLSFLGDLGEFDELSFDTVLAALVQLSDFLGSFEAFSFLDEPLPLINKSVNDMLGFATKLAGAVQDAQNNPSGALQYLEQKLEEVVGLDTASLNDIFTNAGLAAPGDILGFAIVEVDGDKVLKFSFNLGAGFSESLDIEIPGLDLGDLSALGFLDSVFDLGGSAGLSASGGVAIELDFGINLTDPTELYIFDTTQMKAYLTASGNDLAFSAGVGPFSLSIADGQASIGMDVTLDVNRSAEAPACWPSPAAASRWTGHRCWTRWTSRSPGRSARPCRSTSPTTRISSPTSPDRATCSASSAAARAWRTSSISTT